VQDTYRVARGGKIEMTTPPGVLSNDVGSNLEAVLDTGVSGGTLAIYKDGSFSYQHDGSTSSTDTFTYHVTSNDLVSNTTTATIYIVDEIVPPVAVADHYAVVKGGTLNKSSSGVLYNDLQRAEFNFNAVAIDPIEGNIVYAGGGNYRGFKIPGNLYKTTNSGNTWSLTGLQDVTVNAILIDPDDTSVLYAGCGHSGGTRVPLYKSTDAGFSWEKAYLGIPGERVRYGVWGSEENDVFVLGHHGSVVKGGEDDTMVLHFDGESWKEQDTRIRTYFRGIHGLLQDNVVAVGDGGAIVKFNGFDWNDMSSGTTEDLTGVWGVPSGPDAGDYFAVGKGGTVLHYNESWSPMASGVLKDLTGVWGFVDGTVPQIFAVGALGTILRYSSGTGVWTLMGTGGITERLEEVWGTSSGSIVYAVGNPWMDGIQKKFTILRYNGSSWGRMETPLVPAGKSGKLRGIWGRSSSSIFAVGEDGVILIYDGSNWGLMTSGTTAGLYDIWGHDTGGGAYTLYAVGAYGTLLKYRSASGEWSEEGEVTESLPAWNSVTDIKSKVEGEVRTLYASTSRQGVFASPNGGKSWTSLGSPNYDVQAVSVGSVVVATHGGTYGAGWGWMYGQVIDEKTSVPLDSALVQTDDGYWHTTDSAGFYHMSMPSGEFHVTGSADGYAPEQTPSPAQVLSGGATHVSFYLLDPIITVRIDGQEVKAQGEEFMGIWGRIWPITGSGYSIDPTGDLLVQYQKGRVQLGFDPIADYKVLDVLVNGLAQGPLPSYTLENVTGPVTVEVLFAEEVLHPGDLDKDCDVDGIDLAIFAAGEMSGVDLMEFAANFGETGCP
jgi:hypothetical protein